MKDEELDQALSELGAHDVGSFRREQLRKRAHQALTQPGASKLRCAYDRYLEPAMVVAVCAVHLLWAVGAAAGVLLR